MLGIVLLHWHNTDDVLRLLHQIVSWGEIRPQLCIVDNSQSWSSNLPPNVHLITPSTNLGYGGGCNLAIEWLANQGCSYYGLLNVDINIREQDVKTLLQQLAQDGSMACIGPALRETKGGHTYFVVGGRHPGKALATHITTETLENLEDQIVDYIPGTALFIKNAAWQKIGILDVDYFFSGEVADWGLRAKSQGWTLAICPEVIIDHHRHNNNRPVLYAYYSLRNRYKIISSHLGEDAATYRSALIRRSARQILSAILSGRWSHASALYDAMRDGMKGRFGRSEKYATV